MDGILKKIIWAGGLCLVLLTGCRPEGIIPPDDMVNLFTEFYEADACIETLGYGNYEITKHVDSLRVYEPIIERYGYTKEMFRESLTYYLRKPDEIIPIFDRVYDRLSKRSDDAEKVMARLEAEEAEEAEKIVEGRDKEDVDLEPDELEEVEPAPAVEIKKDEVPVRVEDTVKPVRQVEPIRPAEPVKPAVDTSAAPGKKPIRKKLTKKDLKRLEEELK